jgi:predicted porin
MHLALDSVDPFGTGMAGNIENPGMFGAVIRTDNTINFSTSAAGLNGQVAYSFGERAGDTTSGRQVAVGLGYANGPINVQFAWHNAKADPLITPAPTTAAAIAAAASDVKTTLLGAVYDLRVAKIHAAFQLNKSEIDATGVENRKDRNYMLGVSAPIGAGEVRASVLRSDSRIGTGEDADQYAVGYVHNLSKRTNVYTSYARILSDRTDVLDGNVFNVGVQHKF